MKLFICYSHEDEKYRVRFEKHLKQMQREGTIDSWSDRKIIPGKDWNNEIDSNIENSELIIFLISQDFIASEYCYEVEMQKALQQADNGISVVVPVIIRACLWETLPFGKYQALPKDGKPIKSWNDPDKGWMDVEIGLKKVIADINKIDENVTIPSVVSGEISISTAFADWLEETHIQFQHKLKDKIYLSDLFVYPDLKILSEDFKKIDEIESAKNILNKDGYHCITGDEQTGKTALCKQYFISFFNNGFYPLYIDGKNISSTNKKKIFKKPLETQYNIGDIDNYLNFTNKVLIIDDFNKNKLNQKFQERLINLFKEDFETIILFATNTFHIEQYDITYMDDFKDYDILYFGNIKRAEIIERWVALGREQTIKEEELFKQIDRIKIHLDAFVKKNIVPSKPVLIISILQVLEAVTPYNLEITSYGNCYQHLIFTLLNKLAIKPKEIEIYINYLSEIAYHFYLKEKYEISLEELNVFRENYSEKFITINHQVVVSNLIACGIIRESTKGYSFHYKYIYYFYVAKHIADYLQDDKNVQKEFSKLLKYLHREDNANIIVFITHHTKNQVVLDEIQLQMMEIFENENEATLSVDELKFLQDFILEIPKLIIENKDIIQERKKIQEEKDDIDFINNDENNADEVDDMETNYNETFININKTFKSIEITGQIIRNRYSSLKKDNLVEITENAYETGLRFLNYFINISDKFKNEIIEYIKTIIKERPYVSENQLEKKARNTYLFLSYGLIYSVIRKMSLSLGSLGAIEIYKTINEKKNTSATLLIYTSIHLLFSEKIDMKLLEEMFKKLKNNIVAQRIFREFILQHLYLYPISVKDKQTIAEKFNLPMKVQRYLGAKKSTKI